MHVQIRNKIAVIEFEDKHDGAGHANIMREIIQLIDSGFKRFVFDFRHVEIKFNSAVSGFLVVAAKKIAEADAIVVISNISEADKELMNLVGLENIDKNRIVYGNNPQERL